MGDDDWKLHAERRRAAMSDAEIEVLRQRYASDPNSLSMDEVGVLYIVTRERIRSFERNAGGDGDKS